MALRVLLAALAAALLAGGFGQTIDPALAGADDSEDPAKGGVRLDDFGGLPTDKTPPPPAAPEVRVKRTVAVSKPPRWETREGLEEAARRVLGAIKVSLPNGKTVAVRYRTAKEAAQIRSLINRLATQERLNKSFSQRLRESELSLSQLKAAVEQLEKGVNQARDALAIDPAGRSTRLEGLEGKISRLATDQGSHTLWLVMLTIGLFGSFLGLYLRPRRR